MKLKFCTNSSCGTPLTGKQRSYCSDRCRKRASRGKSADSSRTDVRDNQPVSVSNSKPLNIFSLYADTLSDLTPPGLSHLKMHLLNEAKYSDVWIERLTHCDFDMRINEKITAQQTLSSILWRMVDDLQELERIIGDNVT